MVIEELQFKIKQNALEKSTNFLKIIQEKLRNERNKVELDLLT